MPGSSDAACGFSCPRESRLLQSPLVVRALSSVWSSWSLAAIGLLPRLLLRKEQYSAEEEELGETNRKLAQL